MSKQKRKERKEERKEKKKAKKEAPKKGVKKFLQKVGNKLKKTGEDIKFAPVAPFKPIMKRYLDKRNIAHDNSLRDVAIQFAKNVGKFSHFEEQNLDTLYADGDQKLDTESKTAIASGLAGAGIAAGAGDYAGAVKTIISTIIKFFKHLKEKKERGEKLSDEEENVLNQFEEMDEKITEAVQEEAELQTGMAVKDFIFSWKGGVSIIILLFIVFMLIRGTKK